MISISTWNIQCGLGCDGRVDLERIATVLRNLGESDVICLQEVARFMPDLDQDAGEDQVKVLAELFPEHEYFFGAAINLEGAMAGQRRQFGNMILSRLPVVQVFTHPLPQTPDPTEKHMPRQALEVVVRTEGRALRIMTTHLEYHSEMQRGQQVAKIRKLHQQNCANLRSPGIDPGQGLYALMERPESLVVCGDFNFSETSTEYEQMLANFNELLPAFKDAWICHHGNTPHAPTCGIFDQMFWKEGPHCRDFFFLTDDLTECIEAVEVDVTTDASDHQPLKLNLNLNY